MSCRCDGTVGVIVLAIGINGELRKVSLSLRLFLLSFAEEVGGGQKTRIMLNPMFLLHISFTTRITFMDVFSHQGAII